MSIIHQRFVEALRQTQFLPPERLAAYQLGPLERVARHAYAEAPFYRDRLSCLFDGSDFHFDRWPEIPLMTRSEVQANAEALHARAVPPDAGSHSEYHTSGSTGSPLIFRASALSTIASECQSERMWEAFEIDRTAHYAAIRADSRQQSPYPEGSDSVGWNKTFPSARYSRLEVITPIREQAEWLLRRRPRYLSTYPSNAAALAWYFDATGHDLELGAVLTIGETLNPDVRADVERAFGCRVIDSYGATEVGYLAFQCPAGEGYHLAHETVLVEVLDDRGMPVPAGAVGQVVVTALYNYAMPFIRYVVGDYAVAAAGPCRCGRTLPRIASIAGRQRSVFTFIDGSQRSPWGFRSAFLRAIPARQMQIVQTALDTIEIRYVPKAGGAPPDPAQVQQVGREKLHPSVTVLLTAVEDIPRLRSGKIEDCVSLVSPMLAQPTHSVGNRRIPPARGPNTT
jgi:phenylacetate-CoA ligase